MFYKVKHYQKKHTKYYLNDKAKEVIYIFIAFSVFTVLALITGYIYEHNIDLAQVIQGYIIKLYK